MKFMYILPVGNADISILNSLAKKIVQVFICPTRILKRLGQPFYAYDPLRKQYHSARILKKIVDHAPEDTFKIVGITEVDLCTPVLTFVFGEAQLGGKAAVVSFHRLRQEYYSLPPNRDLLLQRITKEAIHEVGHTFGLVHCSDIRCVMSLSNTIKNIDLKESSFCRECLELLKNTNLDQY